MNAMRWIVAWIAALFSLTSSAYSQPTTMAAVAYKIDETLPGPMPSLILGGAMSADGRHVALVTQPGTKIVLVIDGQAGSPHDYDALVATALVFSRDGKHLACFVRKGQKCLAVVDGVEGKQYDGISFGSGFVYATSYMLG